jgi:threonine/homoserine/homoserine lactone efflux protein
MTDPFLQFLAAALVMELTPGPNMAWLAWVAARQGWRPGLAAVVGVTCGLLALAVAAGLGAGALLDAYPSVREVLRWAGVALMLALAAEAWFVAAKSADERLTVGSTAIRGALVNLFNPKAAAVFVVMIPAFESAGPAWRLSLVYVAIATAVHTTIVLFAGSFARLLSDPARERLVRRGFAITLVGVAVWFWAATG